MSRTTLVASGVLSSAPSTLSRPQGWCGTGNRPSWLGQLPEIVAAGPMLDELAFPHPIHVHVLNLEPATGGSKPDEVAQVRATHRQPRDQQVALDDQLLQLSMVVEERIAQPSGGRREARGARLVRSFVIMEVGSTRSSTTSKSPRLNPSFMSGTNNGLASS